MVRKSQIKAIAVKANQSPVVQRAQPNETPAASTATPASTATLSRSAKKKHVKRAKPLTKAEPSPLAVRMQQDLQLAGMAERTAEAYIRAVRKLAAYTGKSPDLIDEEELRAYFYYIRNDQLWEPSTIRVAYSGIKFFYQHTCPRDWPTLKYLRVEDVIKLPTVLSLDDTRTLLESIRLPCHYAFFWTVYSMGLRMQEALHLQVTDIDAQRMLVHVRRGKGHKDRLVPLSPRPLALIAPNTGLRIAIPSGSFLTKDAITSSSRPPTSPCRMAHRSASSREQWINSLAESWRLHTHAASLLCHSLT